MNTTPSFFFRWLLCATGMLAAIPAIAVTPVGAGDGHLRFEPNRGQAHPSVRYLSRTRGQVILLRDSGFSVTVGDRGDLVDFDFPGAGDSPLIAAEDLRPGVTNVYSGVIEIEDIPAYGRVRYQNLWDGIDLVLYGFEGRLEYDFQLAPGADPDGIRLCLDGAESWRIGPAGDLEITLPSGRRITQHAPVIYQEIGRRRKEISGTYFVREDGSIGIRLARYDSGKTLVIDPVLSWATYLGGSGLDSAAAVAVDAAGNSYYCGKSLSTDFPLEDPYQDTQNEEEVFITKMDASGEIVWSTYLGGGRDDTAEAAVIGPDGNLFVAGWTFSSDFPVRNAAQGTLGGASDAFVAKMDADTGTLLYSTYLGGSQREECHGLDVDASGRAILCGSTASDDFPVRSAFQSHHGGGTLDGFIARLAVTGSSVSYASYLGGEREDTSWAVRADASGAVYIGGQTTSEDFPVHNAFQAERPGYGIKGSVTKLTPSGAISYSTYLGGSGTDPVYGIDVDSSGRAVVCGSTTSMNYPVVNPLQAEKSGGEDQFIVRFTSAGSSLEYGSYLGGDGHDVCNAIRIDPDGNWVLTGSSESTDFPVASPDQAGLGGGIDGVVTVLDPASNTLRYSSYLGGSDSDEAWGLDVDDGGNIYLAGSTQSADFPVSSAFQPALNGDRDAFLVKIRGGGAPTAGVFIVGPVAHAPGANNSRWRSDLTIVCPGGAASSLVLTARTGSGDRTRNVTIGAGNTLTWKDVLVSLFGFGQGASVSGTIVITSSQDLEIISRTYNEGTAGTFGQFIPGLKAGDGVTPGRSGLIAGITQSSSFRTNLGAVNLGATAVDLRITLFDTYGSRLGSPLGLTLGAHQWKQIGNILDAVGAGNTEIAYATVEMLTAGGEAWAYASVVDNDSGDPTTVPVSLR